MSRDRPSCFPHDGKLPARPHEQRCAVLGFAFVAGFAIALAAIALLTRRKWLERAMYGVASIGVLVGVLAAMHV